MRPCTAALALVFGLGKCHLLSHTDFLLVFTLFIVILHYAVLFMINVAVLIAL